MKTPDRFNFKEKNHFPGFRVALRKYTGPTLWWCNQCGEKKLDNKGLDIKRQCSCGRWMQWQCWQLGKENGKNGISAVA